MKLSMFEFKKGLGVLMIFFPGLKLPALLENVLLSELKDLSQDDFRDSIMAICKKEKTLYLDKTGRPGVNILALILENVPKPKHVPATSKSLPVYRSPEDLKHGAGVIKDIIASLSDKKIINFPQRQNSFPQRQNSKNNLRAQLRTLKERGCKN